MGRTGALRSLAHRGYRLYFAGQFVSMVGTWMESTALGWLVYRLTGSGTMLGGVTAAGQAPSVALGLLGGSAADRWDRRRVMLWTQASALVIAVALAGLTTAGTVRVRHVLALAVLMGVVNVFDITARQALVPELVPREDMGNAIALSGILLNVSRMIGPAAAGLVIARAGEAVCFWINAASFLAMLYALSRISTVPGTRAEASAGGELVRIREGLRYAAGDPERRSILALLSAISLTGVPAVRLLPVYSEGVLRSGPGGLGFLTAAFAMGSLGGSYALARAGGARAASDTGWAAGLFGLGIASLAGLRGVPAACGALFIAGWGMMVAFSGGNIALQDGTSDEMRGRLMGLYAMTYMAITPFGTLAMGWAADRIGAPAALGAGGMLTTLSGGAYALALARRRAP